MAFLDYPLILVSFILSFVIVLYLTPWWIRKAKGAGFFGKDMHKVGNKRVAEIGGVVVVFGFLLGTLSYIAIDTFVITHLTKDIYLERVLELMASLATLLMVSIIGLIDDILGWKIGLRQYQKPLLVLIAALPLAVVNSGSSIFSLPLLGKIDIGILYPLLVIPIAISGAANGFNMLAGYNGLEAGMGAIILTVLAYVTWLTHSPHLSVMALCMALALLAFFVYNKCPAKIFPGDTLTYTVGALIAIIAILGDAEKIALVLFIPYFIEFILKAKGKMRKESFAHVNIDGSLSPPYKKVYGIEHLAIKIISKFKPKVYEKDVTYSIFALEILISIFVLIFMV